jgi:hypothetical protein
VTAPNNVPTTSSIFQYPPDYPNGQTSETWNAYFQSINDAINTAPGVLGAVSLVDLADTTDPAKGAGLGGYNGSLSYPVNTVGSALTARIVASDLADAASTINGAGLVGYNDALAYAANTVGDWIRTKLVKLTTLAGSGGAALVGWISSLTGAVATTQDEHNGRSISIQDFLTTAQKADTRLADPVLDLSAAFTAAHAALSGGDRLVIHGLCRITSPLAITKRISLYCPSAKDAIVVAVGASADGVTYDGTAGGINGMDINLNVYGKAASCLNAVVYSRVDRSIIRTNVLAGAAAYGVKYRGCLINRVKTEISSNYACPLTGAVAPLDCMLIEKHTGYSVATNANDFDVLLESGRHGVVATSQPDEGNNTYHGTIEGLSGRPMDMTSQTSTWSHSMHWEANGQSVLFTNCRLPRVGPDVQQSSGGDPAIDFNGCEAPIIDGYYNGQIRQDSGTWGLVCGRFMASAASDLTRFSGEGYSLSGESIYPIQNISTSAMMSGGAGRMSHDNIFPNVYMDIWDAGTNASPAGTTLTNCTAAKQWLTPSPCPGTVGVYAEFTVTVAGATSGPHFYIPQQPAEPQTLSKWNVARYVAITVPVYVATGQPDLKIYVNGTLLGTVATKNTWVWVRGCALVSANTELDIYCVPFTGASPATGVFDVGGLSIFNGTTPSKFLVDSGARDRYIVNNVTYTPAFLGQKAFVSGTGKWYLAKGTASSADWIILN